MIEFKGKSGDKQPVVAIVMGSDSDWRIMKDAGEILEQFDVPYIAAVKSAHRMPLEMIEFAKGAQNAGLKVIIAGAGGAAHLPGMVSAATTLPVIGVPVSLKNLDGLDSLLSIVQMPAGVPTATVSIDGAKNAGLLALRILGVFDEDVARQLEEYAVEMNRLATEKGERLTRDNNALNNGACDNGALDNEVRDNNARGSEVSEVYDLEVNNHGVNAK